MAIQVNSDSYFAEYGKMPRGQAGWAFRDHNNSTFLMSAEYSVARKHAKAWFKQKHNTSFGTIWVEK